MKRLLQNQTFISLLAVFTLVLSTGASLFTSNVPVHTVSGTAATGEKRVALTFDDGPGDATDWLLDELLERGVHATFFVLGSRVERYPEQVMRMVSEGHEIGNHSYAHPFFTEISAAAIIQELDQTEAAIRRATGDRRGATLLRPPGGYYTDEVLDIARSKNMPIVLWSVDTRDWETRDTGSILTSTFQEGPDGVQDGSIVLMHDIYDTTVHATIEIVDRLIAEGYTFVTVSQLIEDPQPGEIYNGLE